MKLKITCDRCGYSLTHPIDHDSCFETFIRNHSDFEYNCNKWFSESIICDNCIESKKY